MGIFDSIDKVQKWRYKPDTIELLIPGEKPQKIPNERLTGISIINNYEKNMFPVFKIEITLESSVYYKIIKYKNDVKIHLRIMKYFHRNDSRETSINHIAIDDLFQLILDDDSEDLLRSTKEDESRLNYQTMIKDDTNDMNMVDNSIEFFLYNADLIRGLKQNVNKILENATVTDAIVYICTLANIKNLIMTPPTNNTKYKNLILPVMTCGKSLQFIDTYYGIYNTGSMIYFGLEASYILKYGGGCTAYRKNEVQNTSIVVPNKISAHTTEPGVLEKIEDITNYIVADYRTIGSENRSISNDILYGNDVLFVDNYSGDITTTASGVNINGENSVKVELNLTENPWIGETYIAQTSANSIVLPVRLMDYDIDMLTPNKRFNFIFEDAMLTKKYDGTYILANIEHTFIKDGDDLGLGSVAVFKKVK